VLSLLPAAVALFLLASFLKISFIYNISYVLFGVYALTKFWSSRNARDLTCRRTYVERALIGDVVDVTVRIANRGLLPCPWLRIHDRLPVELVSPPLFETVFALGPRGHRDFTYQLNCRQRGWYLIGPLTLTLGDVLGLNERRRVFSAETHLTVYPKILPLDELGFPSRSPFGHLRSRQPLYEDPSRVVGVRAYQTGDSLRSINWKASASSGTLQVRKLEPAMTLETVILVNVNLPEFVRQSAYSAVERGIVTAASIANHLVSLRQEVGLLTNGRDPAEPAVEAEDRLVGYLPRKGRGQLISVLELLGRLEIAHDRPFWPGVRRELARLPWGATLAFVTPSETDEVLDTVLPLHRAGFNVILIYLDYPDPAQFELASGRARSLGLRAYRVWRESDLEIWRRQATGAEVGSVRAAV
jgi:uncharacterized protein (DUF58 family)